MVSTNGDDLEQEHVPSAHQNSVEAPRDSVGQGITPLPWFQLTIVYLTQFLEALAGLVIYPFVNQFIRETGITGGDEKRTGYFAGAIESSFFLSEALTVVFWGMASDRFGRRPILILGPLGLTISMLGFGMSTTFWYIAAFRCFQGVFNGNIGVSKAVIGELTDESNIADAISVTPFMWSIGATLGPILGGLLSHPAVRWPNTLGRIAYLKNHPYFLPCFTVALVSFSTFLLAVAGLRETRPSAGWRRKRKQKTLEPGSPSSSTPLVTDTDVHNYGSDGHLSRPPASGSQEDLRKTIDEPHVPSFREALTPDVLAVLVNHCCITFCDMCVYVLYPLMWSTSVENGGLGLTPYTIGLVMGTFGMVNSFVQIKFLGKIIRLFGAQKVYTVCFSGLIVTLACFPIEQYFARKGHWMAWVTLFIQLSMGMASYAAYGAMQILITGSAPSKAALGTVNGIAQAFGCTMRSLAPSISSSLFALSLQHGWAGGNAIYYILMVAVAFGIRLSFLLPETLRFS